MNYIIFMILSFVLQASASIAMFYGMNTEHWVKYLCYIYFFISYDLYVILKSKAE